MHEQRDDTEPSFDYLLSRMQACDLVLVEGFKQEAFAKIEVYRAVNEKPPLWWSKGDIVALVTDVATAANYEQKTLPRFELSDIQKIADFVLLHAAPLTQI